MKRHYLPLCFAFTVLTPSGCEFRDAGGEPAATSRLFPFCENGKWGYFDQSGRAVVQPQFTKADDFHDGRALVATVQGLGYLDEEGKLAFTIPGDWSGPFSDGMAIYGDRASGRSGYLDRRGGVAVEPKFDVAWQFSEGLAAVNFGAKWQKGGISRPVKEGGKWGFIDKTGRLVIPAQYESVDYRGFSDGLAQVSINHRFGYIDTSGKVVFVLEYESEDRKRWIASAGPFAEGLAAVSTSGYEGPFSGFVDKTGKFAIAPTYDTAASFAEGLAVVTLDGKSGYVDRNGLTAIPPRFEAAGDFSEGLAPVQEGEFWSYIDRLGKVVIKGPFNDKERFTGGLARVHEGGEFQRSDDGPARWSGGFWFYINRKGKKVRQCCRDSESQGYGKESR
jgi:WG containing repeat